MSYLKVIFLKHHRIIFISLLFIALFIRIFDLEELPNGFHCDEASIGYNAYCIAETGRDEFNIAWPALFRAFGEYKNPIYIYAAAFFVKLFGCNVFAVRMAAVFFGIITIIFTYLLVSDIHNRRAGMIAALLVTISPWHIHFSRQALELIALPAFLSISLYFLHKATRKPFYFIPAAFFTGLTFYTYAVAKLFLPIFLLGFCLIYIKILIKNYKFVLVGAVIGLIVLLPLIRETRLGHAGARFKLVSVSSHRSLYFTKKYIAQNTNLHNTLFKKYLDNDRFLTVYSIYKNYIAHFSTQYLLKEGDKRNKRLCLPGMGILHKYEFYLMLLGIFFIFLRRKKIYFVLLLWLILFPLPASFTLIGFTFAANRAIIGLPVIQIIAAIGIYQLLFIIRYLYIHMRDFSPLTRMIEYALAVLLLFSIGSEFYTYLGRYFNDYRYYDLTFQSQYGEVIKYANQSDEIESYSFYGIHNQPYIFALFFSPIDPAEYQKDRKIKKLVNTFGFVKNNEAHAYLVRVSRLLDYDVLYTVFDAYEKEHLLVKVPPPGKP